MIKKIRKSGRLIGRKIANPKTSPKFSSSSLSPNSFESLFAKLNTISSVARCEVFSRSCELIWKCKPKNLTRGQRASAFTYRSASEGSSGMPNFGVEASCGNESMGVAVYSRSNVKDYLLISTESLCFLLNSKDLLEVVDSDPSHPGANGIM